MGSAVNSHFNRRAQPKISRPQRGSEQRIWQRRPSLLAKSCCGWLLRALKRSCRVRSIRGHIWRRRGQRCSRRGAVWTACSFCDCVAGKNPAVRCHHRRVAPLRCGYFANCAGQGTRRHLLPRGRGEPAGFEMVYDRDNSAIALAKPGDIDWDRALQDAGWFHVTGITPAISSSASDLALPGSTESA